MIIRHGRGPGGGGSSTFGKFAHIPPSSPIYTILQHQPQDYAVLLKD